MRKMVRHRPLVLNWTQTHLCDTPLSNVSRDNSARCPMKTSTRVLRYCRFKHRTIWKVSTPIQDPPLLVVWECVGVHTTMDRDPQGQVLGGGGMGLLGEGPDVCRAQKRTLGGTKGEVLRGEVVGEWTGPEGERGGEMRGKRVEERGPKAHSKKSDFGTPMIYVLFSGLPNMSMGSPNPGFRNLWED